MLTSALASKDTIANGKTDQTCLTITEASCEALMIASIAKAAMLGTTFCLATSHTYQPALMVKITPAIIPQTDENVICLLPYCLLFLLSLGVELLLRHQLFG